MPAKKKLPRSKVAVSPKKRNRKPGPKKKMGRPPGSKNVSTLLRENMRNEAIKMFGNQFADIVKVVVSQAMEGCTTSQKLIFDKIMPNVKSEDRESLEDKGQVPITINITRYTGPKEVKGETFEQKP